MGEAAHESEVSHIIVVPWIPPPAPRPSLVAGLEEQLVRWLPPEKQVSGLHERTSASSPQEPQVAPVSLQGSWDLNCVSVSSRGCGSGSGYWLPWV